MLKRCAIPECRIVLTRSSSLLCLTHWAMVPRPLQESVSHYYRIGKGRPSHLRACRQAIEAVTTVLGARQREIDDRMKAHQAQATMPYRDD